LEEKDRMKKRLLIVVVAFFLCVIVFAQDNNSYRPAGNNPGEAPLSTTADPASSASAASEQEPLPEFSLLQNRYGGITITSYNGTARDVVIPETIDGLPVTIIGIRAFYRRNIASVVIPETVVTVEPLAFAENHLQSANISGCVSIGYEAFAGNALSALTLSERLSSIGPRAFINNRLSAIVLPGKITNIGKDAFAGNPLASITVSAKRNLFASQGFEPSFVNYYVGEGRGAGVYVKDGLVWARKETP
jgi:hypothetical protein